MKRIIPFVALIAFWGSAAKADWSQDRLSENASDTAAINEVVSSIRTGSIQCSDPNIKDGFSRLNSQLDRLQLAMDLAYSPRSGAGSRYMGEKMLRAIMPTVVENRFVLAEALLQASCLDEADKIYRDTISTFIGSNFEAARQRALIGIEDVRAKRRS